MMMTEEDEKEPDRPTAIPAMTQALTNQTGTEEDKMMTEESGSRRRHRNDRTTRYDPEDPRFYKPSTDSSIKPKELKAGATPEHQEKWTKEFNTDWMSSP